MRVCVCVCICELPGSEHGSASNEIAHEATIVSPELAGQSEEHFFISQTVQVLHSLRFAKEEHLRHSRSQSRPQILTVLSDCSFVSSIT